MQNSSKQFAAKASASFDSRLNRSVFLLTVFYSLIIGVLLLVSAMFTYSTFSTRIGARFNRLPPASSPVSSIEMQVIVRRPVDNSEQRPERVGPTMEEVREDLLQALLFVEESLFILGVCLSYLLARMTLRPLKQAYEEQRRFIADASHELRTPLAIMSLELENELSNDSVSKSSKEKAASYLEEVKRMSNMVQDLLILSKWESKEEKGGASTKLAAVDIEKMLHDIAGRLASLAASHNVELKIHTGPVAVGGTSTSTGTVGGNMESGRTGVLIKGNDQVPHVLTNVIQNAIVYSKPAGGAVDISVESKGSQVIVEVKDEGIGMSKEDLKHAFDRFYRADKSRSRATGGSGLGLSIAERGMRAVGGSITLESELGRGTAVSMEFHKA